MLLDGLDLIAPKVHWLLHELKELWEGGWARRGEYHTRRLVLGAARAKSVKCLDAFIHHYIITHSATVSMQRKYVIAYSTILHSWMLSKLFSHRRGCVGILVGMGWNLLLSQCNSPICLCQGVNGLFFMMAPSKFLWRSGLIDAEAFHAVTSSRWRTPL